MNPRYELHTDGRVIEGSLVELKTTAEQVGDYWEIHKVIPSKMNRIKIGQRTKISGLDYESIYLMKRRGFGVGSIAEHYKMGMTTIDKILSNKFEHLVT